MRYEHRISQCPLQCSWLIWALNLNFKHIIRIPARCFTNTLSLKWISQTVLILYGIKFFFRVKLSSLDDFLSHDRQGSKEIKKVSWLLKKIVFTKTNENKESQFLHLHEIEEGLYFHCNLSVCPALLVNKIPAKRMHQFGRGFC